MTDAASADALAVETKNKAEKLAQETLDIAKDLADKHDKHDKPEKPDKRKLNN